MADQPDKKKQQIEKISQRVNKDYTRRDFLKTAGFAAAFGAASVTGASKLIERGSQTNPLNSQRPSRNTNPTGMATGGNYETITVGAGETFTKSFSDGETWENKIIDISANGASYKFTAHANNWTMRNIGISGQLDTSPGTQNFTITVRDPNATGTIENLYMGDGTAYSRSTSPYPSGFYIHPSHAGTLEVHNMYITNYPSHAIYGSGPGNPNSHSAPGSGGEVQIHNSYTADMENSGWRIGTDGSYVENSVAFRTVRGVWAYYNDVEIRNSDLGDNTHDIYAGNGSWGNTGTATVNNTRYNPDTVEEVDGGTISGSSAGTPEERVPEGCPTSAEQAASGGGTGSGSGGTGGTSGGSSGGTSGGSGSTGGQDYETIEANGQTIRIGDGETWENKLIDLGNGNDITVVASGTNWTIRNVGVTGTWHHTTHDYVFSLYDSGGGESTFENIYAGEGDPNAGADERGGVIWVSPDHSGTLNVRNVNFNIEGALGIYGSAPGYNGEGGTIHIEDCYANDCHHTAYRIADNGSSITNSVVYKSGDRTAARGCWIWEGRGGGSSIENVHITTNGAGAGVATKGDPELNMNQVYTDDGTGTDSNPEDFVPEGTPTSAEEAASGGGGGSGGTGGIQKPPENTITLSPESGSAEYIIEASGKIDEDSAPGNSGSFTNIVTGEVSSGEEDTYTFRGPPTAFEADENINVEYNGNEMSLDEIQQLCTDQ